jgi:hypothetical protein
LLLPQPICVQSNLSGFSRKPVFSWRNLSGVSPGTAMALISIACCQASQAREHLDPSCWDQTTLRPAAGWEGCCQAGTGGPSSLCFMACRVSPSLSQRASWGREGLAAPFRGQSLVTSLMTSVSQDCRKCWGAAPAGPPWVSSAVCLSHALCLQIRDRTRGPGSGQLPRAW